LKGTLLHTAFEKKHFAHRLARGTLVPASIDQKTSFTLEKTENYIYKTMISLMESRYFTLADFADDEKSHACFLATIYTGVIRLITGRKTPMCKDIPETLLLDKHRIKHMQREYTKFVMTISVLAMVNPKLKHWGISGESTHITVLNNIIAEIEKNATNMDNIDRIVDSTDSVLRSMCVATVEQFTEFRDVLYACMTGGDIMRIFAKRLRSFMEDTISLSPRFDVFGSIPSIETALDNHQIPAVAIMLYVRIRDYVKIIKYLVSANARVHRIRYRQLIVRAHIRITDEFAKIQKPTPCLVTGLDGQVSRRKH
jgi:hypothetical protein